MQTASETQRLTHVIKTTMLPCKLNPVTSANSSRYNSPACVQVSPRVISQGPAVHTESAYLTSNWKPYIHPEGQPYFLLRGKYDFAVATEANMRDPDVEERIMDCLKVVNKELQSRDIKVPSRCELFLELGNDQTSCNYYFVEHSGMSLFWLEDLGTEFLDIPPTMSASHLEMALERLYWLHVEYFPMHHESHEQEFSKTLNTLYDIFSHGQADRLTSRSSTFPFTEDRCKHFLKLLSRKKGQCIDGYTLCYAARLASSIAHSRFVTFYGQHPAQLDRCQEMFDIGGVQHRWLFTLVDFLMLGVPQQYNALLENLYISEQVYAEQWSDFMSKSLTDWKNTLTWNFPVSIASILLANVRGGTVATSAPAVLSCIISIASASCLYLRHQPLAESSAAAAARYLYYAKSGSVRFVPLSVAFSLPRATYLWGVGLLTAQFLFVVAQNVNKIVALTAACVIAVVLMCLFCTIYPEDMNIASFIRTLVSCCIPHMYALDAREGDTMTMV